MSDRNTSTLHPPKFHFPDGTPKNLYSVDLYIENNPCDYPLYCRHVNSILYFHGFYEIMIIQSDFIRMLINERIYILKRNDLVIFKPLDFHRYYVEKGQLYERWSCEFSQEYISPFLMESDNILDCFSHQNNQDCQIRHLDSTTAAQLIHMLAAMRQKQAMPESGNEIRVQCMFIRLLVRINQLFLTLPPCKNGTVVNEYQKMRHVLDYINENLATNLTLDVLSKQFFISKYYLCRFFKKNLGYTVNEYITYRRIVSAATLLRAGYSVTQACKLVTPEGTSHFISVFKQLTGTTPKQYAKQYQD